MTTTTWETGSSPSGPLSSMLSELATALSRRRVRRRADLVIAELDDHILCDIGLEPRGARRQSQGMRDWIVDGRSSPGQLVFIGR